MTVAIDDAITEAKKLADAENDITGWDGQDAGTADRRLRRTTQETIHFLRQRDGEVCSLCGKPMLFSNKKSQLNSKLRASIDHIVEQSAGGSDAVENLRLAHKLCNSARTHGLHPDGPASKRREQKWLKLNKNGKFRPLA